LTLSGHLAHAGNHGTLAYSPDGRQIFSAGILESEGIEMRIWEATPLKE
jgi:hypothetical protein